MSLRTTVIPVAVALVALTAPARAALPKIGIVTNDATYTTPDVQAKLQATGAFASVTIVDAQSTTPTVSALQAYDAVLVMSDIYFSYASASSLGDNLATYLENGGGVVLMDWATQDIYSGVSAQVGGRYASTYALLAPQNDSSVSLTTYTLGTIAQASHPVMKGVTSFSCSDIQANGCHHLTSQPQHGGQLVASYSDGTPAVIAGVVNGHNVVDLNFFPDSSDDIYGEWDSTSDGAKLMANALTFVAGGAVTASTTSLDFGTVGTGMSSAPQTVTFTNNGSQAATIQSASLTGTNAADYKIQLQSQPPTTLQPAGTYSVSVSFAPSSGTGTRTATLAVTIMGQSNPINVALTGNAIGPVLTANPTTIMLGGTPLNQKLTGSFTLANTGGGQVKVSSIAVTTDGASFTVMSSVAAPFTLNAGASVSVQLAFQSSTPGNHHGQITVSSQLAPVVIDVYAATGDPAISIDQGTVIFGDQHVGASSAPIQFTIDNVGFSDLTVTAISVMGQNASDFTVDAKLPLTIPTGGSATYNLSFDPSALGQRTATVGVSSNDPSNPTASYVVAGTGVGYSETVSPTSLDFGMVVGGQSATKTITITNTSTAPLNVTSLAFSGMAASEYSIVSQPQLPAEVPGNSGTLVLSVKFAPTVSGAAPATLTIGLDDPNMQTAQITLTGTATAGMISAMPTTLDFGMENVGGTSSPMTVTLQNNGTGPLTVSTVAIGGNDAASFSFATPLNTPVTMNPGDMATFTVQYGPQAHGTQMAEVDITSDDPMTPMTKIPLTGMAVQPGLMVNPTSLNFGSIAVNSMSPMKALTITNTGDADLQVSTVSIDNLTEFGVDMTGPFTVPKGMTATLNVTYHPTMAGSANGTLTILPADSSVQSVDVSLSGSGISETVLVTPTTLNWPITNVGSDGDPQTVTIKNTSLVPVMLDMTNGAVSNNANVFVVDASMLNRSLMPGASTTFTVKFHPNMNGQNTGTISVYLAGAQRAAATVMAQGQGLVVMPGGNSGGGCSAAPSTQPAPTGALALSLLALLGLALRRRRR